MPVYTPRPMCSMNEPKSIGFTGAITADRIDDETGTMGHACRVVMSGTVTAIPALASGFKVGRNG